MKFIILFLTLLSLCCTQTIYNPGMTIAVREILLNKLQNTVIPDIMEQFKNIELPPIEITHEDYEVKIYDMEADVVPLRRDQIDIYTNGEKNTLTVTVDDFEMVFSGDASAKVYLVPMIHGEAEVKIKLTHVTFTLEPKLTADEDRNVLDYEITDVDVKIDPENIELTKIKVGVLPGFLLKLVLNEVKTIVFAYFKDYQETLDEKIVEVLNSYRGKIPESFEIPDSPLSISLSFPKVPAMKDDRIELAFDGTVFVTSQGYHPAAITKSEIPSFNPEDKNNIQLFFHEYVVNSAFEAIKKSGAQLTINADMLKRFGMPEDIMKAHWFAHLFPKLMTNYKIDDELTIFMGLDPHLTSELVITEGNIHGEVSPQFTFYVNKDKAFSFSLTGVLDASLNFSVVDKETVVTGSLNDLTINNADFETGIVESSNLPEIIDKFKEYVSNEILTIVNGMLETGFSIPVIEAVKQAFELDIESIDFHEVVDYLSASLNIDIE